jgi:putative inorganic carbon (HCO3(-)) transporter
LAAEAPGRTRGAARRRLDRGDLRSLHPKTIWRFLKTQPASFWFLNVYVFFEYVRPQQIYRSMGTLPYASTSLLLALGAMVMEGRPLKRLVATDYALLVFTGIILASSITAVQPSASFGSMQLVINWLLLYFLMANIVVTERRYLVFLVAFLLYSFKMSQHGARGWIERGFGFASWGATGAPGWFQNSGEFAIQMAIFIPIVTYFLLAFRSRWGWKTQLLFALMPLTAVMSIIASSSRGGLIALAGVIAWMVLQSRHKIRGAVLAAAVAGLVMFALPQEFRDRFDTIGDDTTSLTRKEYWAFGKEIMAERPVLGIGYANWRSYWRQQHGYVALPHNIYIQAGAELGYVGIGGFIGLILATLWVNHRTRRAVRALGREGRFLAGTAFGLDAAMVSFLIAGTFVTVLYYPFFWMNLAMTTALYHSAQHSVGRVRRAAMQPVAAVAAAAGRTRLPLDGVRS